MRDDASRGRSGPWQRLRAALAGVFPADLLIRYRPGRPTQVAGRVPISRRGAIVAFLERDIRAAGPVTIRGRWRDGPGGARLDLAIVGPLDAGQRQRVRNFLLDLLR